MATIPPRLTALDFSTDVERLTQRFSGRVALFREVEAALAGGESTTILLCGKPGIGKSAVVARLLQTRTDVAAYHFCVARRVATITPGTVFRSLCQQLCLTVPGFDIALLNSIRPYQLTLNVNIHATNVETVTGVRVHNVTTKDADEDLEVLLRAPLAATPDPGRRAVILVDALDEALTYKGSPTLVELLAKLDDLPAWVRLFCTSRKTDDVLSQLAGR